MSIMQCKTCEKFVDTDFFEFYFETEQCEKCDMNQQDDINPDRDRRQRPIIDWERIVIDNKKGK